MTNRRGAAEPSRLTPRPLRSNLRFLTPSTKAFSPITPGPPKESRACRASIGARRRRLAREAASGRSRERAPDASGGEYRLRLRVEARRRRGARRLRAPAARSSRGLGGTALEARACPCGAHNNILSTRQQRSRLRERKCRKKLAPLDDTKTFAINLQDINFHHRRRKFCTLPPACTNQGDIRRGKACTMPLDHQRTLAKTHESSSFRAPSNQRKSRGRLLWLHNSPRPKQTQRYGCKVRRRRVILLCHRGRATPTSETPEGFALLFFAPTSPRPMTRAAWRRAPPGLPDPLAHLVCKFWLGEPPRRRRAAPATE